MLCRKKLSPVRRRIRRVCCVMLAVVILSLAYFEWAVRAQLGDVIAEELMSVTESAVDTAVADYISGHTEIGEKLTDVRVADSGAVTAVTTDPAYINLVKAEIGEAARRQIDADTRAEGLRVPAGSFTGLVFLSTVGPSVSLSVDSKQTVACHFTSEFTSAGMNQTLHHITLTVEVKMVVYNPFRIYREIGVTSDYEIAQTVIVGDVPTYGGVVTY